MHGLGGDAQADKLLRHLPDLRGVVLAETGLVGGLLSGGSAEVHEPARPVHDAALRVGTRRREECGQQTALDLLKQEAGGVRRQPRSR